MGHNGLHAGGMHALEGGIIYQHFILRLRPIINNAACHEGAAQWRRTEGKAKCRRWKRVQGHELRIKVKREGRGPKREEGPKEQRRELGSCNLWDAQSRLVDRRALAGFVMWRGVVVVVLCGG